MTFGLRTEIANDAGRCGLRLPRETRDFAKHGWAPLGGTRRSNRSARTEAEAVYARLTN